MGIIVGRFARAFILLLTTAICSSLCNTTNYSLHKNSFGTSFSRILFEVVEVGVVGEYVTDTSLE